MLLNNLLEQLYRGGKVWYKNGNYIQYKNNVVEWSSGGTLDLIRELNSNDNCWYPTDISNNNSSLTFDELRKVNSKRSKEIFNSDDWELVDWTNALAGEVGEACNFAKKMKRDDIDAVEEICRELADIVLYADLTANYLGVDLGEWVRAKFNEVSYKKESNILL